MTSEISTPFAKSFVIFDTVETPETDVAAFTVSGALTAIPDAIVDTVITVAKIFVTVFFAILCNLLFICSPNYSIKIFLFHDMVFAQPLDQNIPSFAQLVNLTNFPKKFVLNCSQVTITSIYHGFLRPSRSFVRT